MLVMPLTVPPAGPVPAPTEAPPTPTDAAASPSFLAILAAAVAAPLPEPVAPAPPAPITEVHGEEGAEGDAAVAVESGGVMSPAGDTTGVVLEDAAAEHGARGGHPGNEGDPTGLPLHATQPHGKAAEGAPHDASRETPAEESGSEDTSRVALTPDASPPPLSTAPVEAALASAARLTPQPAQPAATASVSTEEALSGEGSVRHTSTTPAPTPHAVPSEAARATAAGVLAAFRVSTSAPARSTGSIESDAALGGAPHVTPASAVNPDRAGVAAPDASSPASAPIAAGVAVPSRPSSHESPAAITAPPEVTPPMQRAGQEPDAVRVETPPSSETAARVDPQPVASRAPRLTTREDAPSESVPPIRAPWVATPSALPEPRSEMPDAGRVLAERAPVRTETVPSSQVTVELDPETAGASRVRVAVRGDVVHATVLTDASGIEAMRPQLGELRQALEGQGFREATVQLRTPGDAGAPFAAGGSVELRGRAEQAATGEGPSPEHQPRGRQRGHDQPTPDQRALIDLDEEQT